MDAVAKAGSFRKAAEIIRISQPALSMAIKKLEGELGIVFFSKDHYRATLTPEGRAFYEKSKKLLAEETELKKYGTTLGQGFEPEIRIAVEVTSPLPKILKQLKVFFERFPQTRLNLNVRSIGGALRLLLENQVDFAFTPDLPRKSDILRQIEYLSTGPVSMVPVMVPNFIPKKKKITEEDLRDKNQIIVTATDPYSTKKNFGVLEDGRKWLVNDFMVKKEIIAAGLGWGGLPDYMIKDELKKKSLTTISNAKAAPLEFKTYALRRKDMTYGKVGSELWKSLEQNNFI